MLTIKFSRKLDIRHDYIGFWIKTIFHIRVKIQLSKRLIVSLEKALMLLILSLPSTDSDLHFTCY